MLESRRERRATQAAARLVDDELHVWENWIGILRYGEWLPPVATVSTASWDEQKGLLAASMDDDSWLAVTRGYGWVRDLRTHYQQAYDAGRDGLDDHELDHVTRALDDLEAARVGLAPYSLRKSSRSPKAAFHQSA